MGVWRDEAWYTLFAHVRTPVEFHWLWLPYHILCATNGLLIGLAFLLSSTKRFCAYEAILGTKWHESLQSPAVRDRIVAVAIDDPHCVSKW